VGALAAATVLVGFFFAGQEPRKAMGRLSWLVLLAVIFGVTVVGYYARRRIQSVNFRVFTWIATWEMIRAQPLLGAGIGTFKWAYPAHRRPEIIQIEAKSNTETDHAEDEYLEVWQDEGLLGFGIFLWLILTVSVLGVRALSTLTRQSAQGPPGERAYALLGYLGAYWGGLIHWFVDVSIRFVSSGIYSLLLPGAVAGLVLHGDMPARQDPPLAMDRRLRLGLAVFYTATLFSLRRFYEHHDVLVFAAPTLLIGLLLWLAGELIETRLAAGPGSFWRPIFYVTALELAALEGLKVVVLHFDALGEFLAPGGADSLVRALFVAQVLAAFLLWLSGRRRARSSAAPMAIEPAPASASRRPGALQLSAVVFLAGLWAWGFVVFRDVFMADVNHNVAIFFSKQGVWAKDPRFDAAVERFPPEMREEYRKIGGAIEHYEEVVRLNPHFPMARYFIGNVYNDWGSNFHAEALDARGRGEVARARELKERAEAMWEKSLAAYDAVKAFAPNYVQTHHQVGLVYLKMGEMERSWGHEAKGNEYWDKALENFRLYRQLDPVFPPNYYRTAHVHFVRGDYDKAEDAYLGALKYNLGRFADRNAETYAHLGRLAYTRLVNRHPNASRLPGDTDDFKAAADYYESSVREAELAGSSADRWKLEALKALAVLHTRAGHREKALSFWQKFGALRPDDPDVRSVFGGPPPPSRKP
jgi:tetratricopeptide (TPR) repeat protein